MECVSLPKFLFQTKNIKPVYLIVLGSFYLQCDDFLELDFKVLELSQLTGLNKKDVSQALSFLEHNKLISNVSRNKGGVRITLYDPETISNRNMEKFYETCEQLLEERKKIKIMNDKIKSSNKIK